MGRWDGAAALVQPVESANVPRTLALHVRDSDRHPCVVMRCPVASGGVKSYTLSARWRNKKDPPQLVAEHERARIQERHPDWVVGLGHITVSFTRCAETLAYFTGAESSADRGASFVGGQVDYAQVQAVATFIGSAEHGVLHESWVRRLVTEGPPPADLEDELHRLYASQHGLCYVCWLPLRLYAEDTSARSLLADANWPTLRQRFKVRVAGTQWRAGQHREIEHPSCVQARTPALRAWRRGILAKMALV